MKINQLGEAVAESKRTIMFNLNLAKHCINNEYLTKFQVYNTRPWHQRNSLLSSLPETLEELTPRSLSKKLGVSVGAMRRFESDPDYVPPASLVFKFTSIVNMELRLIADMYDIKENYGGFFMRRSFLLYDWLRNLPETTSSGV